MMEFMTIKAIHLVSMVCWFAGLFYLVRLFIYHREAQDKSTQEKEILSNQLLIMEKRLLYAITWPSAIITLLFGLQLLKDFIPLREHPWLHGKIFFVFLLLSYHIFCDYIHRQHRKGKFPFKSVTLRIFNEISSVLLIMIVFLASTKSYPSTGKAVGVFLVFGFAVFSLLRYLRCRKS